MLVVLIDAWMVYFMLTRGEAFVDQGQQRYEEQQRERNIAAPQASCRGTRIPDQSESGSSMKTTFNPFCFS